MHFGGHRKAEQRPKGKKKKRGNLIKPTHDSTHLRVYTFLLLISSLLCWLTLQSIATFIYLKREEKQGL